MEKSWWEKQDLEVGLENSEFPQWATNYPVWSYPLAHGSYAQANISLPWGINSFHLQQYKDSRHCSDGEPYK